MKFFDNKRNIGLLIFILITAAVLRLWQLGAVPISLDWDEVALGYNAYSLMLTGKDEYGTQMPVVLRSFGDYKPALYTYLIIPFIKIFDLNEIAVRLPSALAGIIAVLTTYFLVKELFSRWEVRGGRVDKDVGSEKKSHNSHFTVQASHVALLSSFLLAISPWHIQFSRVAFEANVAVTFNLLGILFFLKGLKKPLFLSLTGVFLALSIYVYQSEKLFVPLLMLILAGVYYRELLSLPKKYLVASAFAFIIVVLPIASFTFLDENGLARAKGVSIFRESNAILQKNISRIAEDHKNNDYLGLVFDNRRVTYAKAVLNGYLAHFNLNWLFIKGDIPRHQAPFMGLLYLWELPFLLIGLYVFLMTDLLAIPKKAKAFILLWFLATPIPASVTNDVPHAVRTLNFLPTFQIFTAVGVLSTYFFIEKNKAIQKRNIFFKASLYAIVLALISLNFMYYLNQYFVQQNYYTARYWQYGFKEMVEFIEPIHGKYNKVVVASTRDFEQSYMFFLFYLKYDPATYLAEGGTRADGLAHQGNKFSNFEFRPFTYDQENDTPLLLIGAAGHFPEVYRRIKNINYPDGSEAMAVVEK